MEVLGCHLSAVIHGWSLQGLCSALPDRSGAPRYDVLVQAAPVLHVWVSGPQKSIVSADVSVRTVSRPALRIARYLGCGMACYADDHVVTPAVIPEAHFDRHMYGYAASLIRGRFFEDAEHIVSKNDVLAWLDTMAVATDRGLQELKAVRDRGIKASRWKMDALLKSLRLGGFLRGERRFKDVIKLAGEIMGTPHDWMSQDTVLPSRTSLSQYRVVVDSAHCIVNQNRFRVLLNQPWTAWILCDSSPRAGRDTFLMAFYWSSDSELAEFVSAQDSLLSARASNQRVDDEDDVALIATMARCLHRHICVPVSMGVANTSLSASVAALIHTLRLEFGSW